MVVSHNRPAEAEEEREKFTVNTSTDWSLNEEFSYLLSAVSASIG